MILRDYQVTMLAEVRSRWSEGKKRVLGVLPTGGGKTELAISLIAGEATPASRALVVVDRKVLCAQWVERLRRNGIDHVGILQGENTTRVYAPIIVATAQTIRARGVPEQVAFIVIDESHIWHQAHDSVLEALGDARVLGLTATPLREGLGLRFDDVVVGASIRNLIERGQLVKPRYYAPRAAAIDQALESVSIRAGDFAANELSIAMRGKEIMGDVVGEWQRRGEDRQTISFCVDKQHARDLVAEFLAAGVAAEVVIDETSDEERQRIFASFDARETRVLCSVGVLGIGFDSPIASCAILARPTLSLSLFIQQGGRVLRPAPGKADAIVLDHAGNTGRFGLLEEFEPPRNLSHVDKKTDKANRKDVADVWICRACEAVNPRGQDICVDCGEPRRRVTSLRIIDGELVPVQHAEHEQPPGVTLDVIREGYRMLHWYGQSKEMRNPSGWAFYATQRKFRIPDNRAKALIAWDWRHYEPLPPDAETSRWIRADYQRHLMAKRYSKEAALAHA